MRRAFTVLGVPVDAVQIPEVVDRMESWIKERSTSRFIAVTGMHGVMEAKRDPSFKRVLNAADLVVADGMPLVWIGRWRGWSMPRRVYGPELMESFCRETQPRYRHFFYGGAPGVANHLAQALRNRHGIQIAGTYSPPYRPLTTNEACEVSGRIEEAVPDVLWIGMSTPKQERWMFEWKQRLRVPVIVGVGAAFDFLTGRVIQAPLWMREHGMEWAYRLSKEPRRLWRRYIVYGSMFTWNVALELSGLKKFD